MLVVHAVPPFRSLRSLPRNGAPSCQIIIPQRQLKRRSDIFILMVSAVHCAVPEGKSAWRITTDRTRRYEEV